MLEEWPPTETDGLAWSVYFTNPDAPLFGRSYDAIGYYAQAFGAGVDLAAAFRAVLTDVDNPERFALAGTASNRFLDSWAPGLAQADWGGDWIFSGPGFPTNRPQAPGDPIVVDHGSNEAVSQPPYSNHLYVIDARADLVRMEFSGRARVGDGTADVVINGPILFCTSEDGCESDCPSDAVLPVDRVPLRPDALLAVSGGTDGTSGFISGTSLAEECPTPQPSPSEPDEFCRLWRSYLDWAEEEERAAHELDRALAATVVMQFRGMLPSAPAELADDVDAVIETYATFAGAPDPFQVPLSGLDAEAMYAGLLAIDGHCGTGRFPAPP
jgi:hypothetical protein